MVDPLLPEEERQSLAGIIREKIEQAVDIIAECQKYLEKDMNNYELECFPVDVQTLFNDVIEKVRPVADERKIKLVVKEPRLMNYALASTENLETLLMAILTLLINDAVDESSVKMEVKTDEKWIYYYFANSGFGIPHERLESILFGDEPLSSETMQTFRNAISWVHTWAGKIEVKSDIGNGFQISLKLRQFIQERLASK